MSVTALFLLSCLAITAQAQSCTKPVGGPDMNLKGDAILQDTFPDGSSVSFACNVGYMSAGGSATITCTSGSWTTLRLVCERKSCGALPEVDNGYIEYPDMDTLFGDKAVVTCNQGYLLVGNRVIRCGTDGWMDRLPVCEVVKCPAPGGTANGSYGPQNEIYDYREVVRYTCDSGFTLNGSRETACSEDGKFQPEPPKCVRVECKDPVIPNSEFVEGSRPPHKHLASVTYTCKPGYKMMGDGTITCDINSQWSPGVPECNAIECKDPVVPNAEFVSGSRPPYKYSDSVTYKCKPGYEMMEDGTITCNVNGQWSPRIPECKVAPTPPTTTTTTTVKTTEDPTASPDHGNRNTIGIIVGVVVVLLVIAVLVYIYLKKRKRGDRGGPTLLGMKMPS